MYTFVKHRFFAVYFTNVNYKTRVVYSPITLETYDCYYLFLVFTRIENLRPSILFLANFKISE